jgi:SAM-dependent methyltransferase
MGHEVLDEPDVAPSLVQRSHADIVRANALFGGTRAVLAALGAVIETLPAAPTVADVGGGTGDTLDAVCAVLRASGRRPWPLTVDRAEVLAPHARLRRSFFVCGDARAVPIGSGTLDLVIASQVLHHFTDDETPLVLRELDRIARGHVLVSDLRRSWLAMGGLWLISWPLGFHPVSRRDGVTSIRRGFLPEELSALVQRATSAEPVVQRHLGYRVTARWRASHAA